MALDIEGRVSIKIFFNKVELPLGYAKGFALTKLHMSCSTRIGVPMIHIVVEDDIDFMQQSKLLFDNCLITVIIGDASGRSKTYEFRLNSFKYPNSIVSTSRKISVDGYLNSTKYWQETSYTSFTGTSSGLMAKIASDCGLNYVGETTSDSQVWFPRNLPLFEWARSVSERGYKSESSCMQLGLDLTKTLLYQDVSLLENPKTKIAIGKRIDNHLYATDAMPVSRPGSKNGISGYASQTIEQDVLNPTFVARSKVKLKTDTSNKSLSVNRDVKNSIAAGKVRFSPIDPGNVHEFYEAALYQNRRLTNLFTTGLEVMFAEPTSLLLMDCVSVSADNENRDVTPIKGNYRVSSRVIYCNGGDYFEKVELATRSYGYTSDQLVAG
jgi:hypothetical protein